jgi:hypothetical protein
MNEKMEELSVTKRVRKYRKKVKESKPEKWQEIKKKDRERKANARATLKGNAKAYEEHKKKEAERLRKYRAEKKKNTNETSDNNVPNQSAFMTPQSFGKAVKRARKQLPESPRKKKAVLRKLVEEVGLPASETPTKQKTGPKVNEELNKKVSDFYNSDDISWQAPGRKDRVIYRSRNEYGKKQKEYVQSRYMLMSLGEAHELAIKEGISISRSKFCSLRP